MPYIPPERRFVATEFQEGADELNFAITRLVDDYIARHEDGVCALVINEVVGALECAKLELYRRIAAPYEGAAMARNGDVYICAEPTPGT